MQEESETSYDGEVVETYVPDDRSISEFHGSSLDKKLRVIKLGLYFLKEGNLKNQAWDNEQWQQKIDTLKEKHRIEAEDMRNKLSASEEKLVWQQRSNDLQLQECLADAIKLERSKYELQLKGLSETNNELLSKMNKLSSEIEERYAKRMIDLSKQHQSILVEQQQKLEDMRSDYESRLNRQQNSSLKGKDGEGYVLGRLNMLFPTAEIEDTHTIPHRGDFVVRAPGMTMMIETKNYSRNVQKAEIDKFYNDIINPANSDVQCALFVSLNTGICNRDDFQFEIIDNKPVIFIHNLMSNFDSIPLASRFFRMVLDAKDVDFKNKETKDAFKNAASTIKRNFQKQKTVLDRYYNQQMELINGQMTNIESLYGILKQKI